MGGLSIWHLIAIAAVFFLLFGSKSFKFSDMMGDVAKGIKSFKQGMSEDDVAAKAGEAAKASDAAKAIDAHAKVAAEAVKEAGKTS